MPTEDGTGSEERWTPDGVGVRDASAVRVAREHVEARSAQVAEELRRLGFEELGITGSVLGSGDDSELGLDDLDEEALSHFSDEVRQDLVLMKEIEGEEAFGWEWVHPPTGDRATLEAVGELRFLALVRLWEDGTLVRTIVRPDHGGAVGDGMAPVGFARARLPGLDALVRWVAGGSTVWCDKPRLRQFDAGIDPCEVAAAVEAHRARCGVFGPPGVPVEPWDMETVLAVERRTLHVATDHAMVPALASEVVKLVLSVGGLVVTGWLLVSGGVHWLAAIVGSVLLGGVTRIWWGFVAGQVDDEFPVFMTALMAMWAVWVGVDLGNFLVALGWQASWTVVVMVTWLALSNRGGPWWLSRVTKPPPVSAEELRNLYRE